MKKFTEEMEKYIVDNYYNKTSKELAEELDVSYQYVKKIWTKYGMKGKSRAGNAIDLTGKTFGYLTVIEKTDRRSANGSIYWRCKCDCGRDGCLKEKEILSQNLRDGRTISCGAVGKEKLQIGRGLQFQDLTGQTFGQLKVIERIDDTIYNNRKFVTWKCQCNCGNIISVLADNLRSGNTQSCGLCGNNSHGNTKIANILKENNIFFEREKRFETCKDKSYLPFDFYVDNKYLIEFDGKQHFENTNTIFDYENTHKHDLIKNQWSKENNIPLIRIPYTKYDSLKLEDLLLETSAYIIK